MSRLAENGVVSPRAQSRGLKTRVDVKRFPHVLRLVEMTLVWKWTKWRVGNYRKNKKFLYGKKIKK